MTEALLSLKTESPGLASSIDHLCGMMEERVRGWRQALQEHLDILQLFVTFSTLSQEVSEVLCDYNVTVGEESHDYHENTCIHVHLLSYDKLAKVRKFLIMSF